MQSKLPVWYLKACSHVNDSKATSNLSIVIRSSLIFARYAFSLKIADKLAKPSGKEWMWMHNLAAGTYIQTKYKWNKAHSIFRSISFEQYEFYWSMLALIELVHYGFGELRFAASFESHRIILPVAVPPKWPDLVPDVLLFPVASLLSRHRYRYSNLETLFKSQWNA